MPLRTTRPNVGSQDTSPRQRGRRAEFGSFASAAAEGDSYNNALAESVIALSRSELFRGRDQSPPQSVDDIGPATSGRAHSHNPGRLLSHLDDIGPATSGRAHSHNPGRLLSHLGDIRPPGGPPTPRSRTGLEINRPHVPVSACVPSAGPTRSRTGLEINRPHSTELGVIHHHPRSRGGLERSRRSTTIPPTLGTDSSVDASTSTNHEIESESDTR